MTNNMDDLNNRFKKSADNFSLIPSSGIWTNIQADIRRRERKRRFIIFCFLFAGIVTGGILFLINNHSGITTVQTSLPKNNSATTEHNSILQNISTKKATAMKEHTSDVQSFSEKTNQHTNKQIPQYKPSSNSVSYPANKNVIATTETISSQNNLSANEQQSQNTNLRAKNISHVASDSSEISTVTPVAKDSLRTDSKKDSLSVTKNDTVKKEGFIVPEDNTQTGKHQSKWSFAIGVAPTLSYSKHQEQGDYRIISNYRDSSDKNLRTWNYHFTVNYKLLPHLELFTGVGVINFEQELLSKQAVYHYDTTYLAGPIVVITITRSYYNINGDSTGTIKNKISYLEVPIGLRYNLLPNQKFNISLQPEISFNKLIHSEGYKYNFQNRTYEKINPSDLKSWLISYGLGISFQYALQKNLCIEFMPYFRNSEKSIYSSGFPIRQRFQQLEFRLSLHYFLK